MTEKPAEMMYFNGIDGATGAYSLAPVLPKDFSEMLLGVEPDPEQDSLRHWVEQYLRTGHYGLKEGLDPRKLSESGWGIVFAQDTPPAVVEALQPLIQWRKAQAGEYFKQYQGSTGGFHPNDTKSSWLSRQGASVGPADPEKAPYYLMIVGSPEQIPYRFQELLDVQYGVGRIHFDTPEEYASYAESVVQAEKQQIRLPRRMAFWGTANADDPATRMSAEHLVAPLVESLSKSKQDQPWLFDSLIGDQATKANLDHLLNGVDVPGLLFTASHGVGFPMNDPRQARRQGALLCQDWPGVRRYQGELPEDFYYCADDLGSDANLSGLIAFFFACYSAGTPHLDEFSQQAFKDRRVEVADRPFLARLPQRMLGLPKGGALAVVGHVERAWGHSFYWGRNRSLGAFESAMLALMNGYPVGYAFEYFNERYAEISTELASLLEETRFGLEVDPIELAGKWTAASDARNYVLLGDPAVRMMVVESIGDAPVRPSISLPQTLTPVQKSAPGPGLPTAVQQSLPAISEEATSAAGAAPEEAESGGVLDEREPGGVQIERIAGFPYHPATQEVIDRAKALASIGLKRKRPVTSSMLLYALLDSAKNSPGGAADFLLQSVTRQPDNQYEALRRRYFRGTYLISEPAERAAGQKTIPPDKVSENVLRILSNAAQFSNHVGSEQIHTRHLAAALIAPGAENGAARRLVELQINLPELRREYLEFIRAELQKASERQSYWEDFLTTGRPARDTRPRLAGYTTDDTARTVDLIGIQRYVDAFAALIAARTVAPPLSIGLFGEWGSGKTFFMKKLQAAIDQLSLDMRGRNQMQRDLPFYKHIVQIEFNAWHYMEGNIWASLAEHIIDSLAHHGEDRKANAVMIEMLETEFKVKEQARQVAEQEVKAASQKVQQAEASLLDAQAELTTRQSRLADLSAAQVSRDLFLDTMKEKFDELSRLLHLKSTADAENSMRAALDEARAVTGKGASLLTPLRRAADRGWRIAWIAGVILLSAALTTGGYFFLTNVNVNILAKVVSTIIGLGAIAANVAAWLRQQSTWIDKTTTFVQNLSHEYDRRVDQALAEDRLKIERLKKEMADLTIRKTAAQALLENARVEEKEACSRIAQATPAHLLAGFLHDRADSSDYRKHLGLVALVRRDFDTLSNLMEEMNWRMAPPTLDDSPSGAPDPRRKEKYKDLAEERSEEARQVNRIVLYIDDLDRCPPDKVVEVLQAVHLLLAFPLFVVVVGVDARWIKESLKARYRQLLHIGSTADHIDPGENIFGKATPDDYLEKIFQIPFWLKPMDKDASWAMIQGLLKPQGQPPPSPTAAPVDDSPAETPPAKPAEEQEAPAVQSPGEQPVEQVSSTEQTPASAKAPTAARGWAASLLKKIWPGQAAAVSTEPARAEPGLTPMPEAETATPIKLPGASSTEEIKITRSMTAEAERIEAAARSLEVNNAELAFMRCLSPLLGRSPRALKRFVNVYRLVKAGLTIEELEDFAPPDPAAPGAQPYTLKPDGRIYPYQAVQFLLAIDTGLPDLARRLFDALDDPAWLAVNNLKGQLEYLKDKLKLSTANTANDEYNDQRELLRDWWKENDPELAETVWYGAPDLNMLRKWSGYVSRFSFQVYSPTGPLEAA